ncbi:hypothetical protein LCGC14_2200660, partial [marine sediment metagenome]
VNRGDFTEDDQNVYSRAANLDKDKVSELNTKLFLNPDDTLGSGCVFRSSVSGRYTDALLVRRSGDCIDIMVDITPICDVAQNKNKFSYYIHGVLALQTDKAQDYGFVYEFRNPFKYNGKNLKIILNLKALETFKKEPETRMTETREKEDGTQVEVKTPEAQFTAESLLIKLRDNIVMDFQHKVASYNSRPGHALL